MRKQELLRVLHAAKGLANDKASQLKDITIPEVVAIRERAAGQAEVLQAIILAYELGDAQKLCALAGIPYQPDDQPDDPSEEDDDDD